MANEQTSVPLFAASEVLTAANMNLSAGTGVPVFATTVTRDAGFGGANEKVLAEGQLCYLSSTNVVQYYDGAAWATVGPATADALVRVGGGSLSGSATTFSNVFSSTYDAYKIVITNATPSANAYSSMTLGSTTTGYVNFQSAVKNTGAYDAGFGGQGTASWAMMFAQTVTIGTSFDIVNPNLAIKTYVSGGSLIDAANNAFGTTYGILNNNTQYTAFTLTQSSGTITGTVNIYGYALS